MEAKLMVRLVITYAVFDVLIFVPALTLNWAEKMTLSVLTKKLKQSGHRSTRQLQNVIRLVSPESVLR